MRLPKTPEQRRAADAARQRRRRERLKQQAQVDAAVEGSLGLGPAAPLPNLPEQRLSEMVVTTVKRIYGDVDDNIRVDKDFQPALNTALKAEGLIDKREALKAKTGMDYAQIVAGIQFMLHGTPIPKQLDDGKTIEGDFHEVE